MNRTMNDFEVMAPVGSRDSLAAAIKAEIYRQIEVDNKYLMSPKDLKTVRFIDKLMSSGVRVFKIEGRARGPEYVYTVVKVYKEAIAAVLNGGFTEEKKDEWDQRLATVFNRGFWDGYYQGQRLLIISAASAAVILL